MSYSIDKSQSIPTIINSNIKRYKLNSRWNNLCPKNNLNSSK